MWNPLWRMSLFQEVARATQPVSLSLAAIVLLHLTKCAPGKLFFFGVWKPIFAEYGLTWGHVRNYLAKNIAVNPELARAS